MARRREASPKKKLRQKQRQEQHVNVRVGGGGGGGGGYERPQVVQVQDRYEPIGGSYAPRDANDMIAARVAETRAAIEHRQKLNDRAFVQNLAMSGVRSAIAAAPIAISLWNGFTRARGAAPAPPPAALGNPGPRLGSAPAGVSSGPSAPAPANAANTGVGGLPRGEAAPLGTPARPEVRGGGLTPYQRQVLEANERKKANDRARRAVARQSKSEGGGPSGWPSDS